MKKKKREPDYIVIDDPLANEPEPVKPCVEIECPEPVDVVIEPETTGAMLKRLADKAGEQLKEFARKGRIAGDHDGRHRIESSTTGGVGSLVGGTGQVVQRRGYQSYSATKPHPWNVKNENRKKTKRQKAARRVNRG